MHGVPIGKAFNRIILHVLMIGALFTSSPVIAVAVDEDYLKALESEADDTGSVAKKKPGNPQSAPSSVEGKQEFEKLLEFELPSTYKFYTKLNADDQARVIHRYNQDQKMSAASKLIFDIYFERNK